MTDAGDVVLTDFNALTQRRRRDSGPYHGLDLSELVPIVAISRHARSPDPGQAGPLDDSGIPVGLTGATLAAVRRWLHGSYPGLISAPRCRMLAAPRDVASLAAPSAVILSRYGITTASLSRARTAAGIEVRPGRPWARHADRSPVLSVGGVPLRDYYAQTWGAGPVRSAGGWLHADGRWTPSSSPQGSPTPSSSSSQGYPTPAGLPTPCPMGLPYDWPVRLAARLAAVDRGHLSPHQRIPPLPLLREAHERHRPQLLGWVLAHVGPDLPVSDVVRIVGVRLARGTGPTGLGPEWVRLYRRAMG